MSLYVSECRELRQRLEELEAVALQMKEALAEILAAHSMESVGSGSGVRRIKSKKQVRAALKAAEDAGL